MLAQRGMDDTTIEQYLRRIRNVVKNLERFFIFVVVIVAQCLYPCLDFLARLLATERRKPYTPPTCFKDMAEENSRAQLKARVWQISVLAALVSDQKRR